MRQGSSSWVDLLATIRKDDGQDLAEYGIALAVITIGAILISVAVGADVQSLWSKAQPQLQTVLDAE